MLEQYCQQITALMDNMARAETNTEIIETLLKELLAFTNNYFQMEYQISFDLPAGYEQANGLTDDESQTIFINAAYMPSWSNAETLFYFLHELRHAVQYRTPSLFSAAIQANLTHVIQYDGTAFLHAEGQWHTVKLTGLPEFFEELYLSSPCEVDANHFASSCIKKSPFSDTDKIDKIYSQWSPQYSHFSKEEADAVFLKAVSEIDQLVQGIRQ